MNLPLLLVSLLSLTDVTFDKHNCGHLLAIPGCVCYLVTIMVIFKILMEYIE